MDGILQLLIYGLVTGGIYALGAIGVSLVFAILRFAHFAHGDLMTVGAYLALFGIATLGLPLVPAFALGAVLTALLAVAVDRLLYRRLRRDGAVVLLISSFGVALILRSLVQLVWGPENLVYGTAIVPPWRLGDLRIRPVHVAILATGVALVTALHLFLTRSRTGKAMRAMADDPDLARVTGIPTERVVVWTWLLAGGLAAVAGMFLALDTRLNPLLGWNVLLPVFAAALVGGIGNVYGAVAGGLVLGVASELSTAVLPAVYKPAVAFAAIVAVLVWRPRGLLGGR